MDFSRRALLHRCALILAALTARWPVWTAHPPEAVRTTGDVLPAGTLPFPAHVEFRVYEDDGATMLWSIDQTVIVPVRGPPASDR